MRPHNILEAPDEPDEMKRIREKTRTGRPLGTNDFTERLEGQLEPKLSLFTIKMNVK